VRLIGTALIAAVLVRPVLFSQTAAQPAAQNTQGTQPPTSAPAAPVPQPAAPAPGATHLSLDQAEQLALKNNPRVSQAQYQAKAYDEITREFRSAYFPTLQGNVTAVGADSGSRLAAGALNNPIVYSRLGTGVTASQLVTDFGRTSNLVQSAALNANAQEQAVNSTKAEIIMRADAAYLGVLRSRSVLSVARETLNARQLVTDQVSALYSSKLKSSLDLSFANVNLADAKLMLSTAENEVRSSEAALARVLALPGDTRFDLVDPQTGAPPPSDATSFIQQALQKRPDLIQRRLEVESTRKFASAERDLSRPSIGMLGSAGYVPAGEAPIPGTYGAVGLNVTVPVFNGGLFRARQFEAESRAASAESGLRDLQLQIERDVRVAWLNARNAFDRLGLTQELLNQAKLALDLAQSRYNLGLSSIVELSQSQLQYTSAEIARASAQYEYDAQLSILNYQAGLVP
jgi:outer membrane protein